MSETHRIPRPEWRLKEVDAETFAYEPYFEEVAQGLTRKMWEIEEEMLTTKVVELLRSKGWTVVAPGPKRIHYHAKWMLQESAKGGRYCAACGEHVDD